VLRAVPFFGPEEVLFSNISRHAVQLQHPPRVPLERDAAARLANGWLLLVQLPVGKGKAGEFYGGAEPARASANDGNFDRAERRHVVQGLLAASGIGSR